MPERPPSLVLFDPYVGGHHAEHIRHVLSAWLASNFEGRLIAAISPDLLEAHPDLGVIAGASDRSRVGIRLIPRALALAQTEGMPLREISRVNRQLFAEVVEELKPRRVHALFLDHLQLALATSLRFDFQIRISGLLFRPDFHYEILERHSAPLKERIRRLRKRVLLQGALRNPHLDVLFTLDPTAVGPIQRLNPGKHVVGLPDPVDPEEIVETSDSIRASLGIEDGRALLLLFGVLDERKGVFALLRALRLLPEFTHPRIAVVLAGRVRDKDLPRVEAMIESLSNRGIQLVLRNEFVPDNLVQSYLAAADLVLIPYQRHVGSSGVLVRAAAAATPVITQDYGVIGHQARAYRLGQTVDSTDPEQIARSIQTFLADPHSGFDAERARRYARENSVEAYTSAFFGGLIPDVES